MNLDKYIIISPCYNEANLIDSFLNELGFVLGETNNFYTIVIVDDCSIDGSLEKLRNFKFKIQNCELVILSLKFNVGHQAAIKQGLKYISTTEAKGIIVMDSDGEDDPYAILDLIKISHFDIVFVSRGKRQETLLFKLGYFFYKILFKIISGNKINFGNYSMISNKVLASAGTQNFDHYSAFLSKLKFDKLYIQFDRRKRIDGKSKMNFRNLVFHGLKSLLEYSEELLYFFIKILVLLLLISFFYAGYVFYSYFISKQAQPGWTSNIVLSLLNSILITAGIVVLGLLNISGRNLKKHNNDIYTKI